ncbi:MarR family winged helix-turn-helix transcriptional regulator [Rhodoferax sp.]|uniref:MarR family winged helix-turn-helix transcriptional regulator n=1 Tax=Rhodoferax sp. TaxID=50421 RepID=UPI00374DB93C
MSAKKSADSAQRNASLMALSVSLASLQRGYRAAVDKTVAHAGLSQALALPLVMIGRHGDGLRHGVLANLLGIEGPSLVRSIAQLEKSGLLVCQEDAADRRAKTLHLTPAGITARAHIEAALADLRSSLYEGVSDDDVAACLRVFATLEQRLGRKNSAELGAAPKTKTDAR